MNPKKMYCLKFRIVVGLAILLLTAFGPGNVHAGETPAEDHGSILASPLTLFQSIISRADGQRCPMYPSCSHYAAQAVERHGKILGWILTADRLLRCGHDETRRVPEVLVRGSRRAYDPLEANTFWWSGP
jgi:putative component of membrane protein insertase Oxa1/YidC/SpoIIIJ protein YidD